MKKYLVTLCVTLLLTQTGGLLHAAPATASGENVRNDALANQPHGTISDEQSKNAASYFQKASELMGKEVKNPNGGKLGDIHDLVLNLQESQMTYAIVAGEGVFNMGNTLYAVPTTHLVQEENAKHILLDIRKEELQSFQSYERKNWPESVNLAYLERRSGEEIGGASSGETGSSERDGVQSQGILKNKNFLTAKQLIGKNVKNDQNENLGKIDDLAIDLKTGEVKYAVLSSGGVLGVGDKLVAIPLNHFLQKEDDASLYLNVEKENLKQASGFDKNNWPDRADPMLLQGATPVAKSHDKSFREDGGMMKDKFAYSDHFRKASSLVGTKVMDMNGEKLGDVHDLVVSLDQGKMTYVIIAGGGFLNIGDKLIAVSPGKLSPASNEKRELTMSMSKDQFLSLPSFERNNWPDNFRISRFERQDPDESAVGGSLSGSEQGGNNAELSDANLDSSRKWGRGEDFPKILTARDLLGIDVKNNRNEELGEIDDLIVDLSSGKIEYLLMEADTPGFGEKNVAVAPEKLTPKRGEKALLLNISRDQLSQAPTVDKNNLSTSPDLRKWDRLSAGELSDPDDARGGSLSGEVDESGNPDQKSADDTGRNQRDRNDSSVTPFDQSGSDLDRKIIQEIRRQIVRTDTLSMTAKNIKIISNDGKVSLRGVVRNPEEKNIIHTLVQRVDGVTSVDDQLEILREEN